MPMQTLTEIRSLLAERGLRPKHRLGQNFLHDQNQLRKLLDAAALEPGEVVLEVGPGTGTLTEALVERGAVVIACELDGDLASLIEERLGDRITLIRGDCLGSSRSLSSSVVEAIGGRPFKLIANLPYQAASPLMSTLALHHPNCSGQFVTIQREVADRLLASPGTKAYGPLTIIIRAFAEIERIGTLSPQCFWPAPEVTSAMVAIRRKPHVPIDDPARFARFVTRLFTKRRKQLGGTFRNEQLMWKELPGITPTQRPEELTITQLLELERLVS
ncbi:MAG: ribosomal RNA small subunit methyltransferase A, partial [Phycisphaerales bacterium]